MKEGMILPEFPNFVGIMFPPGDYCYKYFHLLKKLNQSWALHPCLVFILITNSLQSTPTKKLHSVFNVNFNVIFLFKRILEPNPTF